MVSRRKVSSTQQNAENRADNPDRRGQSTRQRDAEQSDSQPRTDARRRTDRVAMVSEGTDQASDGQTHEERVAQENENNRDKKLKYRVNVEGTIVRQGQEDKRFGVGDTIELTQADARKHQDAGVPLTLVEDQDSEDQQADNADGPHITANDAPTEDDPETA